MAIHQRRVKVVYNPTAGNRKRKRLSIALKELKKHAKKVKVSATRYAGDGANRAYKGLFRKNDKKPYDVIAAAGGDGTIAEVANGMRFSDTPLLVLPLGTANVLAREIGLPISMQKVAKTFENLSVKKVWPGYMNGKRFVMMVGAGFDSLAVAALEVNLKKRIGAAAYVVAAFKAVKRMKDLNVVVTIDGVEHQCASVIVTKGRLYGGPFVIAPDAGLEKSHFDVVIMPKGGLSGALRYGLALPFNRLHTLKDVTILKATEVTIDSPNALPIQADGDFVGMAPVTMTIDEAPLNILAPVRDAG